MDRADIYSICFNSTSQWLAVSSDKGTIHVFSLKNPKKGDGKEPDAPAAPAAAPAAAGKEVANPTSSFSFMKSLLPKYFSSEWSFAQFRVPDARTIVAFGSDKNSIVVVSADGSFYKAMIPNEPGEMVQADFSRFMTATA